MERLGGGGELLELVRWLQAQANSVLINLAGKRMDMLAGSVIRCVWLIVQPFEMANTDLFGPAGARFLRMVRPSVLCLRLVHIFTTWL